jgi:hypothetical protein
MQVVLSLLLVILIIASAWAAFAMTYGTMNIIEEGVMAVFVAILFTAMVMGFLIATKWILEWTDSLGVVLKIIWVFALVYGVFTAWVGNINLLVPDGDPTAGEVFLVIGLTVMVVGSLIALSWTLPSWRRQVLP